MSEDPRKALVLVLSVGLTACGSGRSPAKPSPPSPPPPAPTVSLVVFRDQVSDFSTSDIRDLHDQVVRFNTADELVWAADGSRFSGYRAVGNFIRFDSYYEVVFVTVGGERRAYFTVHGHNSTDPNRVCDIDVVGGRLVITETNIPMCSPQSSGPC